MASDWNGTYINWTELTEEKIYSPEFEIGTYSWRLLVFPRGNDSQRTSQYIALYLDYPEASFTLPHMCPKAKFEVIALKRSKSDGSVKREATHHFTTRAADCGFAQFIPIQLVENPQNGFLVDDALTFLVNICIQRDVNLEATPPPTRDMTFLGLKKQGDGGYMNCLLQCFFHTGSFREAICAMPASGKEAPEGSVLRAVQSIFYQLQNQDSFVDASSLREAMGLDSTDALSQHDLQKMHSALLETLDRHAKDHEAQSVTSTLFGGRLFQCIECSNVQYASTCKQAYTEIQLDVLGCKDIYESLERFCRFEGLQGTNKNDASFRRLGDKRQGVLFESFPPVLQFHLKRSFYDPDRNVMLKINSYHEFHDELDLDYNDRALLSKNADRTVKNKYKLHSVIGHRGGPNGGHYFAFIRPNEQWYKFDDEDVEEVSAEDAINRQFGTEDGPVIETFSQDEGEATHSMACTLVYIRQSEWETIMCEAKKEGIPRVLSQCFDTAIIDEERRNEREAHLYVVIKLACEKHFYEQLGKSYHFDLANFDDVENYRIHKKTSFEDFKEMVCNDFGIPKHLQRYWLWNSRTNNTMRVFKPLNDNDIDLNSVLDLRHFRDESSSPDQETTALMTIKLFLESPEKAPLNGSISENTLHPIRTNELLIFLKYYDPELSKLSYLGHVFVEMTCQFHLVFEKAKKMAGLALEEKVIGFEEVKHLPSVICANLAPDSTPERALLFNGDIIIIQKLADKIHCEYPKVKSFLEFVQDHLTVTFRALKNPEDKGFKLRLSKKMTYEQVTNKFAKCLLVDDPKKLRLTKHNSDTDAPYRSSIKYNGVESVEQMIMHEMQYTNMLYYEVLDKPLPYLESVKTFKIEFHDAKGKCQSEHKLTLPGGNTVSDLLSSLKMELSKEYNDCDMRVMQMLCSKVFTVLEPESLMMELDGGEWILRVEVIPEDQKNLKSDEFLILFCHCKPSNNGMTVFGDPLWVKVKKDETVREVGCRIKKVLEISDEDFNHWRFAYHGRPNQSVAYLRDDDEILSKFSRFVLNGRMNGKFVGDNNSFIAMVHEDK